MNPLRGNRAVVACPQTNAPAQAPAPPRVTQGDVLTALRRIGLPSLRARTQPEGKTLVLMSDGVVEARSAKGELYGFDRLAQLTLMTAQDIADVARNFGQEDDISVLSVTRLEIS